MFANKLLTAAVAALLSFETYAKNHDAFKSMNQICLENGFQSESYNIQTTDGYNLGLWRIPGNFNEFGNTKPKPAVLMMHC